MSSGRVIDSTHTGFSSLTRRNLPVSSYYWVQVCVPSPASKSPICSHVFSYLDRRESSSSWLETCVGTRSHPFVFMLGLFGGCCQCPRVRLKPLNLAENLTLSLMRFTQYREEQSAVDTVDAVDPSTRHFVPQHVPTIRSH